jgi:hypothetical protein
MLVNLNKNVSIKCIKYIFLQVKTIIRFKKQSKEKFPKCNLPKALFVVSYAYPFPLLDKN